jgi:hypothetical protein
MNKQKPTDKKTDNTVKIAIIGAIVTIATAIITYVIAPIVVQLVKPIPSPLVEVITPTSIYSPTGIGSPQQTSTNPSAQTPLQPTTDLTNQDWMQSITTTVESTMPGLCDGLLLPPNIKPDQEPDLAIRQIEAAVSAFDSWPLVAGAVNQKSSRTVGSLSITITNTSKDTNWVRLDNKIDVTINAESTVPDHINILIGTGCGGSGDFRYFSDIGLTPKFKTYTETTRYTLSDFFSLQPGEFEVFSFPLDCQSPGIYQLVFKLPVSKLDQIGSINAGFGRSFVCPKSYTVWTIDMAANSFVDSESYIWNGPK